MIFHTGTQRCFRGFRAFRPLAQGSHADRVGNVGQNEIPVIVVVAQVFDGGNEVFGLSGIRLTYGNRHDSAAQAHILEAVCILVQADALRIARNSRAGGTGVGHGIVVHRSGELHTIFLKGRSCEQLCQPGAVHRHFLAGGDLHHSLAADFGIVGSACFQRFGRHIFAECNFNAGRSAAHILRIFDASHTHLADKRVCKGVILIEHLVRHGRDLFPRKCRLELFKVIVRCHVSCALGREQQDVQLFRRHGFCIERGKNLNIFHPIQSFP